MKRINSSSWKNPFEGDPRHSQDSAFSSSQDRAHNSQCMEFSQVSTQDLFGQNSQSQNEQSNQKMSMYDKWLSKRSMSSKSNQRETTLNGGNSWTQTSASIITPSSTHLGFRANKLRAEEKDERDLLEMMVNSFHESKQEMKCLVYSLKEMIEKIGGTFNNESKSILSSFAEEIAKGHDSIVSQLQSNEKDKVTEKDLERQLASKDSEIASLETKLKVLEEQTKNTREKDENSRQVKECQEEMKSSSLLIMKKLEEITEKVGNQKQSVNECNINIEELKGDYASTSKDVQSSVKDSETRIMKEMKKLPKDMKTVLDIKSEILTIFEGFPSEIEHSIKTKLQSFSKDIKDGFSKEHKKYNEQVLKKQLNQIFHKMDGLVTEHKKIQQLVTASIQDSFSHHLQDVNQSVKHLKDNSSSDSNRIKQIQQSVTNCQEERAQQIQNIIVQQKEFSEQIKSLLENNVKYKTLIENKTVQEYAQFEKSPLSESDKSTRRSVTGKRQDNSEVIEISSFNEEERNVHDQNSSSQCPTPSNVIHKVVNPQVNNIHMPVINQTNIYPPPQHEEETFKSPYLSLVNKNRQQRPVMIRNQSNLEDTLASLDPNFRRPTQTYSKYKPSSGSIVKPQRCVEDDVAAREMKVNKKETQRFYGQIKDLLNKDDSQFQFETDTIDENQENGYWLRKRNNPIYTENGYIRETPRNKDYQLTKNANSYIKQTLQKSRSNANTGNGYIRETPRTTTVRDPLNSQQSNANSSIRLTLQRSRDNTKDHASKIVRRTPQRSSIRRAYLGIDATRQNLETRSNKGNGYAWQSTQCKNTDTKHNPYPSRKRQWREDEGEDKEDTWGRKQDTSIYDFKDDAKDVSMQRSSYRKMNDKPGSSASSPALTINFPWDVTPLVMRKKPGNLKAAHLKNVQIHTLIELETLGSKAKQVCVQWIPSHANIDGNERADQLAKLGTALDQINPTPTFQEQKEIIKNTFNESWKQNHKNHVKDDPIFKLQRKQQVQIFRLRTGHNELKEHLYTKMGIGESSICGCGTGPQNTAHILMTCPLYEEPRQKYWPHQTSLDLKIFGSLEELRRTTDFLADIGIQP